MLVTTAVGKSALGAATTASGNTAVGLNSADAITTGYHNVALGSFALSANVTGAPKCCYRLRVSI